MRGSILMIIACTLVIGVLGNDEMRKKHMENMKKCLTEIGIEEKDVKDSIRNEEEPDQKIKCFHSCMLKEARILVDGSFDKDRIIEIIPANLPEREKLIEVLMKCSEEKGTDDCETAYLGFKCIRDNKALPPFPH